MDTPVKLLIHGASGRMGQALLRLAAEQPVLEIVAGTNRADLADLQSVPDFDVAIDFSSPQGFDAVLALCLMRKKPLISGTTGLSSEQFRALQQAGQTIAVLWASNFSIGVAVLIRAVSEAGKYLSAWQLDVHETHHIHKKDAPSGTAISLGEAAEKASGKQPSYHSERVGEVIGEHTVVFSNAGERVAFSHSALSRDIFAEGALFAARVLHYKAPGYYRFDDIL